MGANFDERDLASVIIEDSLKEKAASTQMFQKAVLSAPKKYRRVLCVWFAAIYFTTMILTTIFMQQVYENSFAANLNAIKEMVCLNAEKGIDECVNSITALRIMQDERQMFSVAVYDADEKLVAMTQPSLVFALEKGSAHYFALAEYFDERQTKELLEYARVTSEEYIIEAEIGSESEELFSLKLRSETTGNVVWQWENKKLVSEVQEEIYPFSKSMQVRELLSVPCYENEKVYETWMSNEFLQGYSKDLNQDERKDTTSYETFTLSKSKVEMIREVRYMNDAGEMEKGLVVIRSVGNTLTTAMRTLLPVYIIGFALALGGIYLVLATRKENIIISS